MSGRSVTGGVTDDEGAEPEPGLVRQFRERVAGVLRAVEGDDSPGVEDAPADDTDEARATAADGGGETELRLRFPHLSSGRDSRRHVMVASVHPDEYDPADDGCTVEGATTSVSAYPADDPDSLAFLGVPQLAEGAVSAYGDPDLLVPMASATDPPDDEGLVEDARDVVAAAEEPPTVVLPATDPDDEWGSLAEAVREEGATVDRLDEGERVALGSETTVEQLHGWERNAVNVDHRGNEVLAAPEETWIHTVRDAYEREHDEPYRPAVVSVGDATGPDLDDVDDVTAVDDIEEIDEIERLRLPAAQEKALSELTEKAAAVAAGDELGAAALEVLRDNEVTKFLDATTEDAKAAENVVRVGETVQPHLMMSAVAGSHAEMSADRRVGWLVGKLDDEDVDHDPGGRGV